MIRPGDVLSYWDVCKQEAFALQRGMYFRLHKKESVLLMSVRRGAPYADRVEDGGRVLIYEGHDMPRKGSVTDPKALDQPMTIDGRLTQNGLFYEAALRYKQCEQEPELVRVYEKIRNGIWTYNGHFRLVDARQESSGGRKVFKFRLEIAEEMDSSSTDDLDQEHTRVIPASVKVEVWKRDRGRCVVCGRDKNLHFDHIIPYSKGGSSLVPENIQILCARHNVMKRDQIR